MSHTIYTDYLTFVRKKAEYQTYLSSTAHHPSLNSGHGRTTPHVAGTWVMQLDPSELLLC